MSLQFDNKISLGHVLTFAIALITGITAWANIQSDQARAMADVTKMQSEAGCLAAYREAVSEGYSATELLRAVQGYARESEGFTRSKVSFSDNWFRHTLQRLTVTEARYKLGEFIDTFNS